MRIVQFILDSYFAAVLGVAGLAKMDRPALFVRTLHSHYLLPGRMSTFLSRIVPWLEVIVAVLLLLSPRLMKSAVALVVFLLFLAFFAFHVRARLKKMPLADCGCFGRRLWRSGFTMNATTSLIQFIAAMILVPMTFLTEPLPRIYYLICSGVFVGVYGWLLWRVLQRRGKMRLAKLVSPDETFAHPLAAAGKEVL